MDFVGHDIERNSALAGERTHGGRSLRFRRANYALFVIVKEFDMFQRERVNSERVK
jgi:hypothetical protein